MNFKSYNTNNFAVVMFKSPEVIFSNLRCIQVFPDVAIEPAKFKSGKHPNPL